MEEGKMLESKERLEKACKALDIKIDDLFDSQTFINYGENNKMGCDLHNYNTFNQHSNDDIASSLFDRKMPHNLPLLIQFTIIHNIKTQNNYYEKYNFTHVHIDFNYCHLAE